MLLSIIIPIYNAEKVLSRTLESVLNQGLKDSEWELLLVDDGSTDKSLSICKEYQYRFPSLIRIITKKNSGVSTARNVGIKNARGEHIYFMDADDYLMPGGFRYLIDYYLSDEYDILTFYSETIKDFDDLHLPEGKIEGDIVYDGYGCDYLKSNWQTFIWNQIYKLDFIKSNDILFQDLTISEDVMFNLEVWSKNPRVLIVSSKLYRYITYSDNSQATKRRDYDHLRKCINSQMKLFAYISNLNCIFKDNYNSSNLEVLFQSSLRSFMSRVLSSDLSINEFIIIIDQLHNLKLLPLNKVKLKTTKIIDFMICHPGLLPIYKVLYTNLFIPFVLPKLSRE